MATPAPRRKSSPPMPSSTALANSRALCAVWVLRPSEGRMEDLAQTLFEFIKAHQDWASAVMFITAFGESFAFLSLLFPGTTLLIAAGTLMRAGAIPYVAVTIAAILGAVFGDSVSYWIGRRFGGAVAKLWPFTRHPDLIPSGIRFFERHGG